MDGFRISRLNSLTGDAHVAQQAVVKV